MASIEWVLVVEDEADHLLLVREAFGRLSREIQVHGAVDGTAAKAWLQRVRREPPLAKGGMVVLDLGLPRASGFHLLEWMRDVPELETLPVVVFTASENLMDAEHAFNLGARGYFQKPVDFPRYVEIFERALRVVETGPEPEGRS